jgi:hypothetical protein
MWPTVSPRAPRATYFGADVESVAQPGRRRTRLRVGSIARIWVGHAWIGSGDIRLVAGYSGTRKDRANFGCGVQARQPAATRGWRDSPGQRVIVVPLRRGGPATVTTGPAAIAAGPAAVTTGPAAIAAGAAVTTGPATTATGPATVTARPAARAAAVRLAARGDSTLQLGAGISTSVGT